MDHHKLGYTAASIRSSQYWNDQDTLSLGLSFIPRMKKQDLSTVKLFYVTVIQP